MKLEAHKLLILFNFKFVGITGFYVLPLHRGNVILENREEKTRFHHAQDICLLQKTNV